MRSSTTTASRIPTGTPPGSVISLANKAYIDSGISLQLSLVGTQKVDYPDSNPIADALNELTGSTGSKPLARPASLAQVPVWRNNVGADLVSMVRSFNGDLPD